MKKKILFLLLTIVYFNCHSQISYEKGYFIANAGQKINCFIKNIEWRNNPVEFEYKITETGDTQIMPIYSAKEFGIGNGLKYKRATVLIDRSAKNVNYLGQDKEPTLKEELLFLKVLIEGEASLYQYKDGNLIRYFYDYDNSVIEQLIYKPFKTADNRVSENNRFRNQLWENLKCPDINMNDLTYLDYKKKDLIHFFTKYNECKNETYTNYEVKQKATSFNLSLRPGINFSSLSVQSSFPFAVSRDADFDQELTFRFGIEAELTLPFNKNKWALIVEPTYQYFKSESELPLEENVEVDYQSVEIPLGIRHYFFLNKKSKIFVNGVFIIDISKNTMVDYSRYTDLEIKTQSNVGLGIGFKFDNKYGLELRYQTPREILSSYTGWSGDYNTTSIIFGYTFL